MTQKAQARRNKDSHGSRGDGSGAVAEGGRSGKPSDLKGMSYAQGAAHLAPGGGLDKEREPTGPKVEDERADVGLDDAGGLRLESRRKTSATDVKGDSKDTVVVEETSNLLGGKREKTVVESSKVDVAKSAEALAASLDEDRQDIELNRLKAVNAKLKEVDALAKEMSGWSDAEKAKSAPRLEKVRAGLAEEKAALEARRDKLAGYAERLRGMADSEDPGAGAFLKEVGDYYGQDVAYSAATREEVEEVSVRELTLNGSIALEIGGGTLKKKKDGDDETSSGSVVSHRVGAADGKLSYTAKRKEAGGGESSMQAGYDAKKKEAFVNLAGSDGKGAKSEADVVVSKDKVAAGGSHQAKSGHRGSGRLTIDGKDGPTIEQSVGRRRTGPEDKRREWNVKSKVNKNEVEVGGDVDAMKLDNDAGDDVTFNVGGGLTIRCTAEPIPGTDPLEYMVTSTFKGRVKLGGKVGSTRKGGDEGDSAKFGVDVGAEASIDRSIKEHCTADELAATKHQYGSLENADTGTIARWFQGLKAQLQGRRPDEKGEQEVVEQTLKGHLGANADVSAGGFGASGGARGEKRWSKRMVMEFVSERLMKVTVKVAEGHSVTVEGGAKAFQAGGGATYSYDWDGAETLVFQLDPKAPDYEAALKKLEDASSPDALKRLAGELGATEWRRDSSSKEAQSGKVAVAGDAVDLQVGNTTTLEDSVGLEGGVVSSESKGAMRDEASLGVKGARFGGASEESVDAETYGGEADIVVASSEEQDRLGANAPGGVDELIGAASKGVGPLLDSLFTESDKALRTTSLSTADLGVLAKRAGMPQWKSVPGAASVPDVQQAWLALGGHLRRPRSFGDADQYARVKAMTPEQLKASGAESKAALLAQMDQANRARALAAFATKGRGGATTALSYALNNFGEGHWGDGAMASKRVGTEEDWTAIGVDEAKAFHDVRRKVMRLRRTLAGPKYAGDPVGGIQAAVALTDPWRTVTGEVRAKVMQSEALAKRPTVRQAMIRATRRVDMRMRRAMDWLREQHQVAKAEGKVAGDQEMEANGADLSVEPEDAYSEPAAPEGPLASMSTEPDPRAALMAEIDQTVDTLHRCKAAERDLFRRLEDGGGEAAIEELLQLYRRWVPLAKGLRSQYRDAGIAPQSWAVSRNLREFRKPDTEPNTVRAKLYYQQVHHTTDARAADVMWKYGNY